MLVIGHKGTGALVKVPGPRGVLALIATRDQGNSWVKNKMQARKAGTKPLLG